MTTAAGSVRAPGLRGAGGWINTTSPLSLAELRGRVVVLDFWTFCCINCLRVIEELRPIERRFGDRLVVIGVHSPKFPHEQDHAAVERAVHRHRIEHPVLDDPDMETWQRYGVRAWPTLVVIDMTGAVVAMASGEGNGAALEALIERLLSGVDAAAPGPAFTPRRPAMSGVLAFPGKVASDGGSRIVIADTGHDRVLVCDLDGHVIVTIDGFSQPQGVRFDGERLIVCDTAAGSVVAVDLMSGERRTLATGLHSPWDAAVLDGGQVAVAEAGTHRILTLAPDGGEPIVLAGTRAEGLRDGPAESAHLAQPSGLALSRDGTLVFADSEVSALRWVREGRVETVVGRGLFDWGTADGDSATARLQHPLGVAVRADGAIVVADTFNSLLREWRDGRLGTIELDAAIDEPGGLDVLPDGRLIVADTNNHRVIAVGLGGAVTVIPIGRRQSVPLRAEAGGRLTIPVELDLGGEVLDPTQGRPVRVRVTAVPQALLGVGASEPRVLDRVPDSIDVVLGERGSGMLSVDVIASTCHDDVCTVTRSTVAHALTVA